MDARRPRRAAARGVDGYNDSLHATPARFNQWFQTAVAALVANMTDFFWQVDTSDKFDAQQLEAILGHIVR